MTREEREDAIDIIQSILNKYEEDECLVTEITIGDEDIKAFKMAIKALEQEPFINKPCVSSEVCEHDKNVVIDKIRAEIDKIYEREGNSVDCLNALDELKWFIDKCKGESEGANES